MKRVLSVLLSVACLLLFGSCGTQTDRTGYPTGSVTVGVVVNGVVIQTLSTGERQGYKIIPPEQPTDPSANPGAEKFFYGWFLDEDLQVPLTQDTVFFRDGVIYGKWIYADTSKLLFSVGWGTATVVGIEYLAYPVLLIPSFDNSFPVKIIGDSAFYGLGELRRVIVSEGVERIGRHGFNRCTSLESVELPSSLTRIEDNAFEECRKLKEIAIPNHVKSIGYSAFSMCESLTNIKLSDEVEDLGGSVFSGCKIVSIIIPKSVKKVNAYMFHGCDQLREIWCESSRAEATESGWGGFDENLEENVAVHWGESWEYIEGLPALK